MMKFPYPKGTLVRSRFFGFCTQGHVLVTTSEPIADETCGSGYRQSARCLVCRVVVGNVDAGWWIVLASVDDRLQSGLELLEKIEALQGDARLLAGAA